MNNKDIVIVDDEQNKTGLLKRIRRIRGFSHELRGIDINDLLFYQRIMCLDGFFSNIDQLLNEAEYILKHYIEDTGKCADSIQSLSKDVTDLEHRLFELQNENKDLKEENLNLQEQVSILKAIDQMGDNNE